jgi:PAS domain S-box-containing protein
VESVPKSVDSYQLGAQPNLPISCKIEIAAPLPDLALLFRKIIMLERIKTRYDMQALLESYPYLQQFLQKVDQVFWILDRDTGQILYVSPAFEVVWGRPCESFYADPSILIQSVHPEDRIKVLSFSSDTHQKSLNQSYRIMRPDGAIRWVSAHTFVIGDESSDMNFRVFIAQDITDHNQVDQALRTALDRSREQFNLSRRMSLALKPEAVLKTLMSASKLRPAQCASVLLFDASSRVPSHEIEIIASWSSVSYPASPAMNESMNEAAFFEDLAILDLVHPSKPVIVSDIAKDQRLTPPVKILLERVQIQTLVIFPMVALRNWLGCLVAFFPQVMQFEPIEVRHIKVLIDQAAITLYNLQLLQAEAESRHEAERANEIKTQFLAMISHELRTPLTSIKGFTNTLLAEDVVWEADEQRDFIQTIEQEANRLQELIDHLLDLSRLEAGMLPISLQPNSLHEIIEDALPQFQSLTREHKLSIHLPANLPLVYVDPKRISQVLVNLVRNAATYSMKGTKINISAKMRGSFVQMNVEDEGPGIPPGEHKRVFKSFQRGKELSNGSVQGAGLGLAICKGFIETHGGRIWIKKKNTPGATVSFTVPLVPAQLSANPHHNV